MSDAKKMDEMFSSVAFHECVIGAIRVTLFNLGYSLSDIDDVVCEYIDGTLRLYGMEELGQSVPADVLKRLGERMPDVLKRLEERKGVAAGGQEAAREVPAPE